MESCPYFDGGRCGVLASVLPTGVDAGVKPSTCKACFERNGNAFPTPENPGEVVLNVADGRRWKHASATTTRPPCFWLGKLLTVDRMLPECQRLYQCDHEPTHGDVTPCKGCQTCPDWEARNAMEVGGPEVWVAGYPSKLGGADTELFHLVKLWRSKGVAVHLVPFYRPPLPILREMDDLGAFTHLYNPGVFAGKIVVSMCNRDFLAALPNIVKAGRPKTTLWANCMTWTTQLETEAHKQRWIDYHLFQTDFQRKSISPYLAGVGPISEVPFRTYFDPEHLPESTRDKPTEYFGVGRISRPDPAKFHQRTWGVFDAIHSTLPKKVFILGHGAKVKEKIGSPPGSVDYLLWDAGGTSQADFYSRVHAVVHVTGGSKENLPRVLLECWASDTVFVGEDSYGYREFTRPGVDCLLARTPEEAAVLASMVGSNDDLKQRLIEGGREALKQFSADEAWKITWRNVFQSPL